MGDELMHTFLLLEVVDHSGVYAGELLEALLATWVGQAARIEDKTSAITRFIHRHLVDERKN